MNPATGQSIEEKGKIIQMICGSLIMGVVAFLAVLFVIADWNLTHSQLSVLTMVGLALAVTCYGLSVFLPNLIAGNAIQMIAERMKSSAEGLNSETGRNQIASQYITTTIIRYAIIEGAVFANLIFFFVDHSLVCLAAAAVGVALMVLFFPLPGRMMNWVQNQISIHTGKFSV